MRHSLLPAAMLVATALGASAQSTGAYRVAGTVVSAVDSHPLQRATVELLDVTEHKSLQKVSSDEYGRFTFTAVPAGSFVLQGSAPGYLPTLFQEHEGFSTAIVTGTGADTQSLELRLNPKSAITGTVRDEVADPVQGAMVHLFRRNPESGDGRMLPSGTASTNDLGQFELPNLAPGDYFLAVTASPWYAVHPGPASGARPVAGGFAESIDPRLDVAYPVVYYPGTTDPKQASAITLKGGDTSEISLQLQPQPALSITIPRTPPEPGQPQVVPLLETSLFGTLQPAFGLQTRMTQTEAVLTGVAPGDYFLADPRHPDSGPAGLPAIHVADSSLTTAPSMPDTVPVRLTVKNIAGGSLGRAAITLTRIATHETVTRTGNARGEVEFNVSPGDYSLSAHRAGHALFLTQLSGGSAETDPNLLHIASGQQPTVSAIFVEGRHTLKGVAQKQGKAAPGIFLLLVPATHIHDLQTVFRQQSDLDGSFYFEGLPPGSYLLFAIDDGWNLEWRRESVLAAYLPKSVKVQIADTGALTTALADPVEVQPK